MDKKKIIDGSNQYASYMAKTLPQRGEDGAVKYYFSGSLAMLLLSSATAIQRVSLDDKGVPTKVDQELPVSEKTRECYAKGARPLSVDIDIVSLDENYFVGKGKLYATSTIREKCDLATTLCPAWGRNSTTMYLDVLSDERVFKEHDIVELIMPDGTPVLIADPFGLVVHKFGEGVICYNKNNQEKYEKDLKDIAALFNGFGSLYENPEFKQKLERVIEICPETALTRMLTHPNEEGIKQLYEDVKDLIDEEYQELFAEFVNAVGVKNQEIVSGNIKQ